MGYNKTIKAIKLLFFIFLPLFSVESSRCGPVNRLGSFLLYKRPLHRQPSKFQLRLLAFVSTLTNWNLQSGAHPEQRCHSEPVRLSGVGISIEFQIIHRHTDRSILPFPGIHP